jgi:hypothetical protein
MTTTIDLFSDFLNKLHIYQIFTCIFTGNFHLHAFSSAYITDKRPNSSVDASINNVSNSTHSEISKCYNVSNFMVPDLPQKVDSCTTGHAFFSRAHKLSYPKKHNTGPYHKPVETSLHSHTLLLQALLFYYLCPSHPSPSGSLTKILYVFLTSHSCYMFCPLCMP